MCRATDEVPSETEAPHSFTRKSAELLILAFGPLPGCAASELDVEVDDRTVEITGPYSLAASLPLELDEECNEDAVTASWDKSSQTLSLNLPIVQAKQPDLEVAARQAAEKEAAEKAAAQTAEKTAKAKVEAVAAQKAQINAAAALAAEQQAAAEKAVAEAAAQVAEAKTAAQAAEKKVAAAKAEAGEVAASLAAEKKKAVELKAARAKAEAVAAEEQAAGDEVDEVELQKRVEKAAALKEEGNKLYKAKNYNRAISKYSDGVACRVSQMGANSELQLALLGNRAACYMMVSKFEEALSDCEAALLVDSSCIKALLRSGKCNLRLGKLSQAEQSYMSVKALEPRNKTLKPDLKVLRSVQMRFDRAKMFHEQDLPAKVVPNLIAVLEECTAADSIRLKLAMALIRETRYSEAASAVMPVLKTKPNHARALTIRAEALYYSCNSDLDLPCKLLETALISDPDEELAKQLFKKAKSLQDAKTAGNAAFKCGKCTEAIAAYREALEVDPSHNLMAATLYSNIAAAYMKQKKWAEAAGACIKALDSSPKNQKALLRRAQCRTQLEQHAEAVQDYESLSQMDETNREYRQALRQAQLEVKKAERKDYYKILGVEKNATETELKKAFRKAAMKCHPDKVAPEGREAAEIQFKELNEAHEVLTNKETRHRYDTGQDIEMDGGMGGGMDVGDLFAQFFGGGGGGGGGFGGPRGASGFAQGGHGFTFRFG